MYKLFCVVIGVLLPVILKAQEGRSPWTFVSFTSKSASVVAVPKGDSDQLIADIPVNRSVRSRFALIVGNGQYARNQMGLPDVKYAENDAKAFKQYAIRFFGVPPENILYAENATAGIMHSYQQRMALLLEAQSGPCELYFFFAGHGLSYPNASSFQPAAVDDDPYNPRKDADFRQSMERLTVGGRVKVIAITDACFSGQTREGALAMASRGVRYKALEGSLPKGVLHMAAANERQLAFACEQSGHGLFTYCLLSRIRSMGRVATWSGLWDEVSHDVVERSIRERHVRQDPVINGDAWYVQQFLKSKIIP
jgi:hypothetical protein